MTKFSRLFAGIVVVLFNAATLHAQSSGPRPDGWNGVVINVSSPDDAIRLFGTPIKDKDKTALDTKRTLNWLSDKQKQKVFRTLIYKKLHNYKQVNLSFLDNKLVLIRLEAPDAEYEQNWIDPDELENLFAVAFKPHSRRYRGKLPPPSYFQPEAPTELKKDEYDYWYDMVAVTEKVFIIAMADNYKYISGLFDSPDAKKRKEINARGKRYPGYVSDILIVSRSLASA